MKSVECAMIFFFVCLFAMDLPVFAQLYQYTDANGVLSFTDDLSRLPVAQRDRLKVIHEEKTDPVKTTQTEQSATPSSPDKNNVLSEVLMEEADELRQENKKLKEAYALIIEENKQLAILRQALEGKKSFSTSEWDDFNKKVSDVNLKIQQYEVRLQAHKDRAKAYNMKLEQLKKLAEKNIADQ